MEVLHHPAFFVNFHTSVFSAPWLRASRALAESKLERDKGSETCVGTGPTSKSHGVFACPCSKLVIYRIC